MASDRITTGPQKSTNVGDIVSIPVPALPPYGMELVPDPSGNAACIKSWERVGDGKLGVIQKHGGVRIGDVLIAINETSLDNIPFNDVMGMLKDKNMLRKVLHFASFERYTEIKNQRLMVNRLSAPKPNQSSFVSVIRRAHVNQRTDSPFVEYEVVCSLRLMSTQVQKERVVKWSAWKRYQEFAELDRNLRADLGWQMENIEFPSSYLFVFNKLAIDFIEKRKSELEAYWEQIMKIERITEFNKHHCNQALKEFLEVENWMTSGQSNIDDENDDDDGNDDGNDDGKSYEPENQTQQRIVKRTSMKSKPKARQTLTQRRRQAQATENQEEKEAVSEPKNLSISTPTSSNNQSKSFPLQTQPQPQPQPQTQPQQPQAKLQSQASMPKQSGPPVPPPPPPSTAKLPPAASKPPPSNPGRGALLAQINSLRKD